MEQKITPLELPAEWPDIDCPRKRVREKFPVLGALVCWFFTSKWRMLDNLVETNLKQRNITIYDAWSDYPELQEIVRDLQIILEQQIWGFKPVFVPEDQYSLLGRIYTGDLCEVEAVMAIEEHFAVDIVEEDLLSMTMIELAKFIKKNS